MTYEHDPKKFDPNEHAQAALKKLHSSQLVLTPHKAHDPKCVIMEVRDETDRLFFDVDKTVAGILLAIQRDSS